MKLHAYGFLSPPAKFGVPDGDAIVFAPGSEVYGPTVITGPLVVVGSGTMPKYRNEDDAVKVCVNIGQVAIEITDNYFKTIVEADDFKKGKQLITDSMNSFVNALSVIDCSLFDYFIDGIETDEKQWHKDPDPIRTKFICYDTISLKEKICQAPLLVENQDEILARAIFYYNLALATYELGSKYTAKNWQYFSSLVGSSLLNIYKATTVITGDPSQRGDRHQMRLNDLDLTVEEKETFANMKEFRDSYDIAHYSLDSSKSEEIHQIFEKTKKFSGEVILRYAASV